MKKLAVLAFFALTGCAHAASLQLSIVIQGPVSTAVTCGANTSYTLNATVPAGTVICPITVAPGAWNGALTVSQTAGPQANAFAISGKNLVAAADITQTGTYTVTIQALP